MRVSTAEKDASLPLNMTNKSLTSRGFHTRGRLSG